jgi:hypothetical protein
MALEQGHNIPGGDGENGKVCYNDGDKACYVHNNHGAFCRICSRVLRLDNNHVCRLFFALYNDVYGQSHVHGHLHHNS